jgi:hypothetical protein
MPLVQESIVNANYQALGMDEVARDISNIITAVNALEGGGSDYTETIVNISSAQILAMGTTPIELLPSPGAGKYYDINKVVIEYTHVSTPYTFSADDSIGLWFYDGATYGDYSYLNLPPNNVNYVWDTSISGTNWNAVSELQMVKGQVLNSAFELGMFNGTDPTLGNGTMRVKIYSKTITFGA